MIQPAESKVTEIQAIEDMTALILAGGRGTRIAAVAPDVPKPMVTVAGQPFLEWLVRRLARQGFTDLLLSIGYKAEVIVKWLEKRAPSPAREVIGFHLEASPLGTGGAIADALPKISSPYVLILNGDTLLLAELAPALEKVRREELDGVILARELDDTGRYGRLGVEGGMLKDFQEKQPGSGLINGGIYAFKTAWLRDHMKTGASSFEIDDFPRFLAAGARIGVEVTKAPFIDIGTPETLVAASDFVTTHKDSFT